jgi:hypothetical protein
VRSLTFLFSIAAINGCIIVGDLPKDIYIDDTGGGLDVDDDAMPGITFPLNPSLVLAGNKVLIEVTAEPMIDFDRLSDVYTMESVEVLDFQPKEASLELLINVPRDAEPGPVSLIMEYGEDGTKIVPDALTVLDPDASDEEGDTGETDTGETDTGDADTGDADSGETDTGDADTGDADSGNADTATPPQP